MVHEWNIINLMKLTDEKQLMKKMMKNNDESMINQTNDKKLEALALSMTSWGDFIVEQYRKDQDFVQARVVSEFKEFLHTGEIGYLLSTLYKVAEARGWSNLAKETGISRPTLYSVLSGTTDPKISTLMKIFKALGVKIYTRVTPFETNPWKPISSSKEGKALTKTRTKKISKQKAEAI